MEANITKHIHHKVWWWRQQKNDWLNVLSKVEPEIWLQIHTVLAAGVREEATCQTCLKFLSFFYVGLSSLKNADMASLLRFTVLNPVASILFNIYTQVELQLWQQTGQPEEVLVACKHIYTVSSTSSEHQGSFCTHEYWTGYCQYLVLAGMNGAC